MLVWHGSDVGSIEKFYDLTHLGTFESAFARVENYRNKYFYNCSINISNFIKIIDYGNEMDLFGEDLYRQNILDRDDLKKLKNISKYEFTIFKTKLADILYDKGIDGFYYENTAESVGDISYIVVDGKNIKINEIFTYEEIKNKMYI